MHMRAIDATINALIPPLADLLERATASGDIDCPNRTLPPLPSLC